PEDHPESAALREPWVLEEIEFFVTPELTIELKQNDSEEEKKKQILRAKSYPELAGDPRSIDLIIEKLKAQLGEPANPNDESDFRHLAHAIAKRSPVFVTRDGELCTRFRRASQKIDILILTPGEFIAYLDELLNTPNYAPSRFSGTMFQHRRLTRDRMEPVISQFQNAAGGEAKNRFRDWVEKIVSEGPSGGTFVISDPQGSPTAIYSCRELTPETLSVPIFRVQRGHTLSTWAWHLLAKLLLLAERRKRTRLLVSDPCLQEGIEVVLNEMEFLKGGEGWERAIPSGIVDRVQAIRELVRLAQLHSGCAAQLRDCELAISNPLALTDSSIISVSEHRLWPLKIADANIPTLVVPIQRRWAEHLVDPLLSENGLFASDPELALNREGVYYRASKPAGFTAPARILWYVSQDPKQIRACSRLIEVRIGRPKELFKRYEHLGVFSLENIYELCNEDVNAEIMVLHFDDTLPFPTPVPWSEVQAILQRAGCPGTFQSPHRITPEAFKEIGLYGMSVRNV
ncbi:MAG: hypothetical protein ACRDHZ_21130, partial [Ktedonobacteraceae bacterium]